MTEASTEKMANDRENSKESEEENLTYDKSGIKGIQGESYQAKLLMLFLYRGMKYEYDFLLATEMVDAEKFDDIVFRYLDHDKIVYRFLQAKHVVDESKVIPMEALINEGDKIFGLLKYFNSYRKIEVNPIFENTVLKEFTICTNIKFADECLSSLEPVEENDDILDLEDMRGHRFQFKNHFQDKGKVYDLLRKAAPVNRLANQLAKCFLFDDTVEEENVKYINLKKYYVFLTRRIIDITNQSFCNEFLSPCEKEANDIKKFREIFLAEVCRETNKQKQSANKKKPFLELNLDKDILIQLKKANKKFKFSESFEEEYHHAANTTSSEEFQFQKLDILNDEEITAFLQKLVFAVNQPNEEELGKIIEREVGKEFALMNSAEAVCNKLFIKMLNWMKNNEGHFFSYKEVSSFFKETRRGLSVWFDVRSPSKYFTGRITELRELHTHLQSKSVVPCVVGLGGIGKSETVRKYIQEHSQYYDHNVVWIHAENRQELEESFCRLAKDFLNISVKDENGDLKDMRSVVASVYEWFSNKKGLFVFDNATKFKATVDEGIDIFLPNVPKDSLQPSIIITSRNQEWDESKFKKISITIFTKNDAVNLIRLTLNENEPKADSLKLSEKLQYFPLALQQSIAYIKQVDKEVSCMDPDIKFTISDYLKEFDKKTKELLDFQFPDDFCDTYTKTTFTTWNITIDRIKRVENNGVTALKVFNIITYFSPENIPSFLFKNYVGNDIRKLGAVLSILKKYCLIDLQREFINIHRLLQLVNRIHLDESEEERSTVIKCVEVLGDNYPRGQTTEDFDRMRKILPHLEKVLLRVDEIEHRGKCFLEEGHIEALLKCLAISYINLGLISKAKEICERRVEFANERFGKSDLRTADALRCLGSAWGDLGDNNKMEILIKKAVDIFEATDRSIELPSSYYENLYRAFDQLGASCRRLGKFNEAKEYMEKALHITEKMHGSESHNYAHVLANLALVYRCLGDQRKNFGMIYRSLQLLKSHYGESHVLVGIQYMNLGIAYLDVNKHFEALSFLETALKIFESQVEPISYHTGKTLGAMGIVLMTMGQFSEAKDKLENNLEIFELHFGPESVQLEAPLTTLSFVLGCLNQRDRQLALLKRLLKIQTNFYGPHHQKIDEMKNLIETVCRGDQSLFPRKSLLNVTFR